MERGSRCQFNFLRINMWTLIFMTGMTVAMIEDFSQHDRCAIASEQIKRSIPDLKWVRCVKVEK
jgi:hypothetical protein